MGKLRRAEDKQRRQAEQLRAGVREQRAEMRAQRMGSRSGRRRQLHRFRARHNRCAHRVRQPLCCTCELRGEGKLNPNISRAC